ncbi:MAG TPA: nuclear transport factor 2 family protein [Steroidobacteraceae bacterium]|nr:nuclear transport factor 2 family protein [Steroidobacteraceae bacterium]
MSNGPGTPALAASALALWLCSCAVSPPPASSDTLRQQVVATETAFAATLAARDFKAFAEFVAEDAVFLNGGNPLRGKATILVHWKKFFDGAQAPFSWKPELVEVVGNGDLAESTGPVYDASGTLISHYYSTWRRDALGHWHIVLDNGYDACACQGAGFRGDPDGV